MIKAIEELISVFANNKINIEIEPLIDGSGRVNFELYVDNELAFSTTEKFIDVSDLQDAYHDITGWGNINDQH